MYYPCKPVVDRSKPSWKFSAPAGNSTFRPTMIRPTKFRPEIGSKYPTKYFIHTCTSSLVTTYLWIKINYTFVQILSSFGYEGNYVITLLYNSLTFTPFHQFHVNPPPFFFKTRVCIKYRVAESLIYEGLLWIWSGRYLCMLSKGFALSFVVDQWESGGFRCFLFVCFWFFWRGGVLLGIWQCVKMYEIIPKTFLIFLR